MTDRSIVAVSQLIERHGEEMTARLLSGFSCPPNPEIEGFIRTRAIDFTKRSISITHIVFDGNDRMVGYFTLACRPLTISPETVSRTVLKKIATHGAFDEESGRYTLSAFLIAQFGKNFAVDGGRGISGNELMGAAIDTIKDARKLIGGGVIFLEAEDRQAVLDFYQNDRNRFRPFSTRVSSDGTKYTQLLRYF